MLCYTAIQADMDTWVHYTFNNIDVSGKDIHALVHLEVYISNASVFYLLFSGGERHLAPRGLERGTFLL